MQIVYWKTSFYSLLSSIVITNHSQSLLIYVGGDPRFPLTLCFAHELSEVINEFLKMISVNSINTGTITPDKNPTFG